MTVITPSDNRLVVLDRDGVINRESADFVKSADEWIPLDGSIEAIARLSDAGFFVAVASNQSGLARGLFDASALAEMHSKLCSLVAEAGGRIDHIVICPHGPDDNCDCRKPKPGLLHQIGTHLDISLSDVPVIGDSLRDLEAAQSVSARPILVRTGNGRKTEDGLPAGLSTIEVYDNLAAAAFALLSE
jgi:D-glycero-D-manno-heptose 1,7-bisphosphate phosphatase